MLWSRDGFVFFTSDAGELLRLMLNSILSGVPTFIARLSGPCKACVLAVLLVLQSSLLAPGLSHAQTRSDNGLFHYSGSALSRVYADAQWGVQAVRHSDLDFYPLFSSGSLGLWLFDNIGVEVFGDAGLGSFEDDEFSVEVEEAGGVAMRFQSPPRNGFSLYLTAGYVDYQVAQVVDDERGRARVSQGFAGLRLSLGIAQRLPVFDSVLLTGEYRNYYSEDELQLDSLALGLRINIQ